MARIPPSSVAAAAVAAVLLAGCASEPDLDELAGDVCAAMDSNLDTIGVMNTPTVVADSVLQDENLDDHSYYVVRSLLAPQRCPDTYDTAEINHREDHERFRAEQLERDREDAAATS